jgi:hypothetical protein
MMQMQAHSAAQQQQQQHGQQIQGQVGTPQSQPQGTPQMGMQNHQGVVSRHVAIHIGDSFAGSEE